MIFDLGGGAGASDKVIRVWELTEKFHWARQSANHSKYKNLSSKRSNLVNFIQIWHIKIGYLLQNEFWV